MGYRDDFFKANPSPNGLWMCVNCGNWFPKDKIQVDHRIPKKHGGTDHISNLQPMCEHCNKSKNSRARKGEYAETMVRSAMAGDLGDTLKGMAVQELKNALGVKYKRK